MYLRYKYRLYPDECQEQSFRQSAGTSRWLWNHFLNKQQKQYKKDKTFIFYHDMAMSLPYMKKDSNTTWLKETHSQVLQQKLKDLDKALKNCFKYKNGFPKFKKKSNFSDSFRYAQGIKLEGNKVYLPKIGWVKQDTHRKMPSKPTSATIILEGNKWYISYVVEKQELKPKIIQNPVGIDLGLKSFITTSDGEVVDNPRFYERLFKQLKRKQRHLSRKQKGSNNRFKQQLVVKNQHTKIANQRHNFLHQVSAQITNEYDLICVEDLNIAGMTRNRKLSRAIGQAGWSAFVNMLEYKSVLKGGSTVKIDRWAPSTKTCSACGTKHDMPLNKRTMECSCGFVLDRDANAALNIRRWGIEIFNEKYTAGTAEIYASGDTYTGDESSDLSRHVSLNEEKYQGHMCPEATTL